MLNKKGMSFLGMLIALALIMTVMVFMIKTYQKNLTVMTGNQSPSQSVQDIINAKKNIEKAAAQRTELDSKLYK
ncbi:MAG: hypothetical protein IKN49_07530 [Elusimicrobiaceae bacterium]|nr:hypothetical protein [Elusimicrobiaceae bacterium]